MRYYLVSRKQFSSECFQSNNFKRKIIFSFLQFHPMSSCCFTFSNFFIKLPMGKKKAAHIPALAVMIETMKGLLGLPGMSAGNIWKVKRSISLLLLQWWVGLELWCLCVDFHRIHGPDFFETGYVLCFSGYVHLVWFQLPDVQVVGWEWN